MYEMRQETKKKERRTLIKIDEESIAEEINSGYHKGRMLDAL